MDKFISKFLTRLSYDTDSYIHPNNTNRNTWEYFFHMLLIVLGLQFNKGLVRSGLFGYNIFLVVLALAVFDQPAE